MKNGSNLRTPLIKTSNAKVLMIVCGVLLVLALVGMAVTVSRPAQVKQETNLISCIQKNQFDYTTYLKPSYLYGPAPTAPVDTTQYPEAVVGKIAFTYSFQPTTANASGTAWVEAVVENPGIWQKTLDLVPNTTTSGNFTLAFSLDTQQIGQIFTEIMTETGLTTPSEDVTLNAYFQSGSNVNVQKLPITIVHNLIEISNSLSLTQAVGSGQFAYNINPVVPATQTTIVQGTETTTVSYPSFNLITQAPESTTTAPTTLGPGQTAFVNLIDKINVDFGYQFAADKPVNNLKTIVDIVATLEAPQAWSKNFTLLHTEKSGIINVNFPIDVAGYSQLVKSIISETGVTVDSYNLTITANIHTTGDTAFGPIDETFSPTMRGTIKNNVLVWDKDLTNSKTGAITQTATVNNPNKILGLSVSAARPIFILLSCLFAGILVGLLVLYYLRREPNPAHIKREVQKIQKKYGARIAESVGNPFIEGEMPVSMNSMEDLIKIADELGKPVVHQSTGPAWEVQSYYVIDGSTRYQYAIPSDKSIQEIEDREEDRTEESQ